MHCHMLSMALLPLVHVAFTSRWGYVSHSECLWLTKLENSSYWAIGFAACFDRNGVGDSFSVTPMNVSRQSVWVMLTDDKRGFVLGALLWIFSASLLFFMIIGGFHAKKNRGT